MPDLLTATLLRHMTAGLILSSALNAGPNPVVTGAGEEITVTKHPGRAFIAINSKLRWTLLYLETISCDQWRHCHTFQAMATMKHHPFLYVLIGICFSMIVTILFYF